MTEIIIIPPPHRHSWPVGQPVETLATCACGRWARRLYDYRQKMHWRPVRWWWPGDWPAMGRIFNWYRSELEEQDAEDDR